MKKQNMQRRDKVVIQKIRNLCTGRILAEFPQKELRELRHLYEQLEKQRKHRFGALALRGLGVTLIRNEVFAQEQKPATNLVKPRWMQQKGVHLEVAKQPTRILRLEGNKA